MVSILPPSFLTDLGLSDALLSSDECERLLSGGFVAPHSADDAVGELAFVGSSGFASGFCLRRLCGRGRRSLRAGCAAG